MEAAAGFRHKSGMPTPLRGTAILRGCTFMHELHNAVASWHLHIRGGWSKTLRSPYRRCSFAMRKHLSVIQPFFRLARWFNIVVSYSVLLNESRLRAFISFRDTMLAIVSLGFDLPDQLVAWVVNAAPSVRVEAFRFRRGSLPLGEACAK